MRHLFNATLPMALVGGAQVAKDAGLARMGKFREATGKSDSTTAPESI
jgi:hypothetical protein